MAQQTEHEKTQDTKKKENEKPVANGVKKDEPEELVEHLSWSEKDADWLAEWGRSEFEKWIRNISRKIKGTLQRDKD